MRTTIDGAGRLVIPKPLRDELGLDAGAAVEINLRGGSIEIEPVSEPMRLVERDGFLAAEIDDDGGPALTAEDVREQLDRVRR